MSGAICQPITFSSSSASQTNGQSKRSRKSNGAVQVQMRCTRQSPCIRINDFSGLRPSHALDFVKSDQTLQSKLTVLTSVKQKKYNRIVPKAMFERFKDEAIKVIMLAQEESRRLGHNQVGTEQILLGLIGEGTGISAKVMKSVGISLKDARVEVEKLIGIGSGIVGVEFKFTPHAKRVLELSLEEARQLGHSLIGSEHLLLGLLREEEGVVALALEGLGADITNIRTQVIRMVVKSYGTNLTEGKLDPELGRKYLIELVIQILNGLRELGQLTKEKNEAVHGQNFEKAIELRDREMDLWAKTVTLLEKNKKKWIVSESDIQHIVASLTGIPVSKLYDRLLEMEETLHTRVIGQDEAIKAISSAIRRAVVELKNPNRCIFSFIFSNPKGVGKSELAKLLATYYFGSEEDIIRLDMLPGYFSYTEDGQLTEASFISIRSRLHIYKVIMHHLIYLLRLQLIIL